MSEPRRLAEVHPPADSLELRAAEMVRAAAQVDPWDDLAQARLRRKILDSAAPPPHRWPERRTLTAGAVALCCVGLALAVARGRPGGLAAHLTTSAEAQVQVVPAGRAGDDDQLSLMRGVVNVRGADPTRGVAVHTPHLTAVVHAASYFIEVAGDRTTLLLTEGEAWVGAVVRVHLTSGQSIRSDDPRLQPPAPPPPARPPALVAVRSEPADGCAAMAPDARFDCYFQLSMGSDEVAQNALFETGVIESEYRHDGPSAIVTWGAYLKRFPQGALAPEARFSILSEYLAERRGPESLQAAAAFLERYPSDPRDDEVRLAAASLCCTAGEHADRGLALVEPMLSRVTGATRGEALFMVATCDARLGRSSEAREADRTYRDEFPTGRHAAEARAQLSADEVSP